MSMYRNRYFLLGVLMILLGIQFRMVDSFVLNEPVTRTLAKVTKNEPVAQNSMFSSMVMSMAPNPTKRITPPRWLGLAMITLGSVVALHAIAIPRHRS